MGDPRFSYKLLIRLHKELADKLNDLAKKKYCSRTDYIRAVLVEHVEKENRKNQYDAS